jgi:hypothetical protein
MFGSCPQLTTSYISYTIFFGSFLVHGPCTVVNVACYTFLAPYSIRRRLIFIQTLQQGVTPVSLVTLPEFAGVRKTHKV